MSEKDDTLNENPLSRALNIASGILGSSQESVASSSSKASPMQDSEDGAKEELAGMLLKMLSDRPSQASAPEPADSKNQETDSESPLSSLAAIASALPPLLQALSGKGDLIEPEKLNLVKALKPYMSSEKSDSIDRAVRMANITKAAKSALSALGR